jgi:hypothetical protein
VVGVPVGAQDVRQDQRVGAVGLRPGTGVPVAVAVDGLGVDSPQPVAGRSQRRDQQAAVGLDRDVHRDEPSPVTWASGSVNAVNPARSSLIRRFANCRPLSSTTATS